MWRQFSPGGGTCLPQQRVSCIWVTQVCLFRRVAGGHFLTFWLRSGIDAMVLSCFLWIPFMLKCHLLYFKETSLSGKNVRHGRVLVTCSVVFKLTRLEIDLLWHIALEALTVCMCVSWHCNQDNSATHPPFPRTLMLPFLRSSYHEFSSLLYWESLFSTPIALLSPKCRISRSLWGGVTGIIYPAKCAETHPCVCLTSRSLCSCLMPFHFMVKGV